MFKEVADIQTADMLHLPVPEAEFRVIKTEPTAEQREILKSLSERADDVRDRKVEPEQDNMLTITNDGKKLALDQRLINPLLPDDPNSKVNSCVDNVFAIWQETSRNRSAQLLFSDMSTPKGDGTFNIYDDIREKLVARGVPREEIAFIHEADTDKKKEELFARVRKGEVRILMGSTPVPMYRISSLPCTIWTCHGVLLTLNSEPDALSVREMKIQRCRSFATLRRTLSTPISGRRLKTSRSSSRRS